MRIQSGLNLKGIGQIYRTFGPYLRPYWVRLVLAYSSLIGTTFANLLRPWPLKFIFDYILLTEPMPAPVAYLHSLAGGDRYIVLAVFCAAMVAVVVLHSLFSYGNTYVLKAIGHCMTNDIRVGIFDHLQTLPLSFRYFTGTGDVVLRLTSDLKSIRDLMIDSIQKLAGIILTFVSTVAVMLWVDWRLTLVALTILPPLYVVTAYYSRNIKTAVRTKRRKEGDVASIVQETVTSMALVQAYTQEDEEKRRLESESAQSTDAGLKTARLSGTFVRLIAILQITGLALVVWYGAVRVLGGELTPGDLIVFTAYVRNLYTPVDNLSTLIVEFAESLVSGERIVALVNAGADIKEARDAVEAPPFSGKVAFRNVAFGYRAGEPILRDLTFTVRPGQMVALVGSSGTGKSTVVNLLLRFFDPWEGRILIDGQDIRRFTLKSLRRQLSVVLQESLLFRRTLRENIAYGKLEASFEEVVAAAKEVQAHDFIMKLPQGYETILDERGSNLSGGQKQRIALARALLRNAPIVILDEPVSDLDAVTESQLHESLARLLQGKTMFVIAHQLSTIKRADLIVVIEEGKATEQGTHRELMAKSNLYRHLYNLQYDRLTSAPSSSGLQKS